MKVRPPDGSIFWKKPFPIWRDITSAYCSLHKARHKSRTKKTYGTHGARNILTNIALKILFKPNDVRDSEEYSKLLGKITVEEDTSRSRGGGNRGVSTTRTQNQRDLMMPQELRAMPLQEEIIIYDGISHPIKAQKICYYKDRVFIPRFKGQRNAIVRPLKERMVREEVIADAVKAIVRDESRTYRNRLEDNINEYAARQAFTTAVVGNFIGRVLEREHATASDGRLMIPMH